MTPACCTVMSALAAGDLPGPTSAGMAALRVGWLTAVRPDDRGEQPQHGQVTAAGQQRLRGSSALVTAAPAGGDQHQQPAVHRVGDRPAEQAEDDQRHQRDDRGQPTASESG